MKEKVPAPENIEAPKLEWGPELGVMTWNDAQVKITELNSKLTEGEKPWRLPSKDELLMEFNSKVSYYDFDRDYYWSGTTEPNLLSHAYNVCSVNGHVDGDLKDLAQYHVRCVREAA